MSNLHISRLTLQRLPFYLHHLKNLKGEATDYISATAIADALKLNNVQVRKDLAAISSSGRPKVGYKTSDLITEIEDFLGYNKQTRAVLVGAGKLGKALLDYDGFKEYGLDIMAAFDSNLDVIDVDNPKRPILPLEALQKYCHLKGIEIGIITVPARSAQQVCDLLVKCGIMAIWNFAPVHLIVPEQVLLQNENMASSLAVLSTQLNYQLHAKK